MLLLYSINSQLKITASSIQYFGILWNVFHMFYAIRQLFIYLFFMTHTMAHCSPKHHTFSLWKQSFNAYNCNKHSNDRLHAFFFIYFNSRFLTDFLNFWKGSCLALASHIADNESRNSQIQALIVYNTTMHNIMN